MEKSPTSPVPSPVLDEPIPSKPLSNYWKYAAIVLFILVVAVGTAFAYMLLRKPAAQPAVVKVTPSVSPTVVAAPVSPAPIAGWKTYTNTLHSYSIDYPSNWRYREYSDPRDGAGFSPLSQANDPANEAITIDAARQVVEKPIAFEEYVKTAAANEIQNYNEQVSSKKIQTAEGLIGYETTWMVQPMMGTGGKSSESLPITYFDLPASVPAVIHVYINSLDNLAIYEQMIKTVKILKTATRPTVDDSQLIRSAIYKANNWDSSQNVDVTVNNNDGKYASGYAGSGYFYAEKVNGTWEIVAAGNGVITCASLTKYPDFPKSLIAECYDTTSNKSVQR